MSKIIIAVVLLVLAAGLVIVLNTQKKEQQPSVPTPSPTVETPKQEGTKTEMRIESSVFQNNQPIPSKYACDGQNTNPPLTFSDVPADAKSLALIMDDPDAPMGTWVHWTVWNISPTTEGIEENSVPSNAVDGTTSFGKLGYGGPCPPSGTHRYFFKLYALDTTLSLDQKAKKEDLEKAMEGHTIAKSELIGLYSKK